MKFKLKGRHLLVLSIGFLYGFGYLTHLSYDSWLYLPNLIVTVMGTVGCLFAAGMIGIKNLLNGNHGNQG